MGPHFECLVAANDPRRLDPATVFRLAACVSVAAMYPPFVVPGLLAGDKQLVCEVAGAAVFFSDIHEFTSASGDGLADWP